MYGADGGVVGYAASSGASMSAPPGPSPSFVVFDPAPSYPLALAPAPAAQSRHNTPNSATRSTSTPSSSSSPNINTTLTHPHPHPHSSSSTSHRRRGGDDGRRSRTTSESRRSSPARSAAPAPFAPASSSSPTPTPHLPHTTAYSSDSSADDHYYQQQCVTPPPAPAPTHAGSSSPAPRHQQHHQQQHARRAPSPLKLISPSVNSAGFPSNEHQQQHASRTASRPTTPKFASHTPHAPPSRPSSRASSENLRQHSRIPTPNRLRSNSSGANLLAYSDTETLADIEPPPPLPSLYRPDSRQQPHAAFPGLPASPSTPIPMSSLSSHAPEAPHRLAGGVPLGSTPPSGIPVLKSRTRSNPRPPSPEFAVGEESLRDAAPPFRVDLDATLAEIEDELEARAAERYMLAKPSPAPRTPSAPTTPITPHTRSSRNGNGGANGTGSVSNRPKRRISQQQPSPKASVTTPLGRSATLNGHSPAGSVGRSTLNARKRHGSDSAHVALAGTPKTPRTPRAGSSTPRAVVRASTDTPRSNLGTTPPTQKHIGIAAHFIPPENSYTPPKGADWDDVVLPTVARKTGISVASRNGHGQAWASGDDDDEDGPSGDDDLAVEWDKDGNPIRWEPQTRERVPRERGPVSYSSDFGPSFPRPGRRDTANDSIELTPIRASAGQPSALEPASNSRRQSRVPEQAQPQTQPQRQPSVHAPAVQADSFAQTLAPPPGKKRGKKRADNSDEVKAGCGCVIM